MSANQTNQSVERACPVCGQPGATPYLSKPGLTLGRCPQCSMVFATPVDARFLDGDFYENEGGYYTSDGKMSGDFAAVRYQREMALFRRHCRGGDVLDVGCNTGAFLHQLRSSFPDDYRVLGVDVSGPALRQAESIGVPVEAACFDEPSFVRGPFDAISFWAVLEHVERPLGFLRKAATLLRPGGHAFLLVPNLESLAVRLLGGRYRYLMAEHINYFSMATLRKLVEAVPAFEVVEARTSHFNPVVIWQDLVRPRGHVPAGERAHLMTRTNAWKQSPRLAVLREAYEWMEDGLASRGWADNLVMVLRRRR